MKDIETKSNNEKNKFEEFQGNITFIIQSRHKRNILIACSDGKVFLFTLPKYRFLN